MFEICLGKIIFKEDTQFVLLNVQKDKKKGTGFVICAFEGIVNLSGLVVVGYVAGEWVWDLFYFKGIQIQIPKLLKKYKTWKMKKEVKKVYDESC